MLRRIVKLAAVGSVLSATGTGCLNLYPSDPVQRMEVYINESENYRQIGDVFRRFWFTDQPSHLTPERIHGGIL